MYIHLDQRIGFFYNDNQETHLNKFKNRQVPNVDILSAII